MITFPTENQSRTGGLHYPIFIEGLANYFRLMNRTVPHLTLSVIVLDQRLTPHWKHYSDSMGVKGLSCIGGTRPPLDHERGSYPHLGSVPKATIPPARLTVS